MMKRKIHFLKADLLKYTSLIKYVQFRSRNSWLIYIVFRSSLKLNHSQISCKPKIFSDLHNAAPQFQIVLVKRRHLFVPSYPYIHYTARGRYQVQAHLTNMKKITYRQAQIYSSMPTKPKNAIILQKNLHGIANLYTYLR